MEPATPAGDYRRRPRHGAAGFAQPSQPAVGGLPCQRPVAGICARVEPAVAAIAISAPQHREAPPTRPPLARPPGGAPKIARRGGAAKRLPSLAGGAPAARSGKLARLRDPSTSASSRPRVTPSPCGPVAGRFCGAFAPRNRPPPSPGAALRTNDPGLLPGKRSGYRAALAFRVVDGDASLPQMPQPTRAFRPGNPHGITYARGWPGALYT